MFCTERSPACVVYRDDPRAGHTRWRCGLAGKGKAFVFAGVPAARSGALHAGQWLNAALAVLGGKGGGKPVQAQGSGPKV